MSQGNIVWHCGAVSNFRSTNLTFVENSLLYFQHLIGGMRNGIQGMKRKKFLHQDLNPETLGYKSDKIFFELLMSMNILRISCSIEKVSE